MSILAGWRRACLVKSIRWPKVSLKGSASSVWVLIRIVDTLDSWFHDLQQYESTLDALATASLDQAFTDELNAIEQCTSSFLFSSHKLTIPQGSAF